MFDYIPATPMLQNRQWQKIIDSHPGDDRWVNWSVEYKEYYRRGMSQPFVVTKDGDPVGEVTILYSPQCKALAGNDMLANADTANVNGLRIEKQYEGQGHISKLLKAAETFVKEKGYKYLTIGVTSTHLRTKAIYNHMGYTTLLFSELDEGVIVEYYRKEL